MKERYSLDLISLLELVTWHNDLLEAAHSNVLQVNARDTWHFESAWYLSRNLMD